MRSNLTIVLTLLFAKVQSLCNKEHLLYQVMKIKREESMLTIVTKIQKIYDLMKRISINKTIY